MQRRENVQANEASSFPLVDFISKWRLRDHRRGQTAPAAGAAGEPELKCHGDIGPCMDPLLLNRSESNGDHEVPYPLPDAFLQPYNNRQPGLSDFDEDEDEDEGGLSTSEDDEDAQSIKSYGSGHIRTYDRLSLSRVSSKSSPLDEVRIGGFCDNDLDQADDIDDLEQRKSKGCSTFSLLSTLCLPKSSSTSRIDQQQGIEMQSNNKNNSKRDNNAKKKKKGARSDRFEFMQGNYFLMRYYERRHNQTLKSCTVCEHSRTQCGFDSPTCVCYCNVILDTQRLSYFA